jgi:hypothetical protein
LGLLRTVAFVYFKNLSTMTTATTETNLLAKYTAQGKVSDHYIFGELLGK